jgi:tRNA A-37 threonylcarbamoyl transferase component Bud32/lipopolysaccharide biosynthesis regulator YciM
MNTDPSYSAYDADPTTWVKGLLHRFADAWQQGLHPAVEDFLPTDFETQLRERLASTDRTIDALTPAPQATPASSAGPGVLVSPLPPLRYKPLQLHDRGNLGEVLRAQDEELNREVALKRLQARHADSPQSRRRFLREAELTGRLEHPGVVPVYGLVHDGDGRPCYAMRFIQGESLKEAIERFHIADKPGRNVGERRLALRQLLTSFVTVCKTVAYAHSRGILHRDIKPANIMLGKYGETLVVDWGLAKSFERDEAEPSQGEKVLQPDLASGGATQVGDVMGTPAYFSPEQAAGLWDVVGPASDIFALGATLYNLLTNHVPYDGSGVLAIMNEAMKGQVIPPRQRKKGVPPALEAICLKAMAHQQEARYSSALDLASDVEHWLADEPVEAYREPVLMRAGRWLRKHRPLVAGMAAAAVVALVSLIIGIWVVAGKAAAERQAKNEAQHRLEQIEKGTDILGSIFADLDPHAAEKEGKPLGEILGQRVQRAAEQLAGDAIADALTVAKLQEVLGKSLIGLGHYTAAAALLEKSAATRATELGDDHQETLECRNALAGAYQEAGTFELAIPLLERILKTRQLQLGEDHTDTLISRNNLANAYQATGQLDLAIPLMEGTLKTAEAKLGDDHPYTLAFRNGLATTYEDAGQLHRAIPLLERTVEARQAQLGDDHPDTLSSRGNLANAYRLAGQQDRAISLFERTLKACEAKLGDDHPLTLNSRNNLATAYKNAGNVDRAIPLLQLNLKASQTRLGDDHPDTLTYRNNLGSAYLTANKLDLAMPLCQRTLKDLEAKLGPDHPTTLAARNNLASAYKDTGKLDLAIPLFQRNLEACEAKLGGDHANTLTSRHNLARAYQAAGQLDQALALFDKLVPLARKALGSAHPLTLQWTANWIAALEADHQYSRAVMVSGELLLVQRKQLASDDPRLAAALAQLGSTLVAAKQALDAETVLRESLAIRTKKEPEAWTTFNTQSLLGAALLGQKKYAEAEPLLVSGYQGMKQRQAKIAPQNKVRLTEALERLVQLYEATGKTDEAAKWRKELDAAKTATKDNKQR